MREPAINLTMSPEGQVALAASEGIVPAVYLDSVGVPTFGIGVTKWAIGEDQMAKLPDTMPSNLSDAVSYSMKLFQKVLPIYENAVQSSVTVPLLQHEYDALVHFCYNVGAPNFKRSKLLRNLNAGRYEDAGRTGFHGWIKPPELRGRRDHESDMFLTGDYGNSPVPIYKTNGKRKLVGRLKSMPRSEVLALMGGVPEMPTVEPPAVTPVAAPAPQKPQIPQELIKHLEDTSAKGSRTQLFAKLQKMLAGMGVSGGVVVAFIKDLDAMQLAMLLGFVGVMGLAAFAAWYIDGSRDRKGNGSDESRMALRAAGFDV